MFVIMFIYFAFLPFFDKNFILFRSLAIMPGSLQCVFHETNVDSRI